MRIRTRITGLVLALLCSMIGAVAFSLFELSKVENEIQKITKNNFEINQNVSSLQSLQLQQAINFERVLRFSSNSGSSEPSFNIPLNEAQEEYRKIGLEISKILKRSELSSLEELYKSYNEHAERIFKHINQGNLQDAYLESLIITVEEENLRSGIQNLKEEIDISSKASALRATKVQTRANRIVIMIILVTTIIGLTLALSITRTITRPLRQAANFAREIAEGNTSVDIKDYGDNNEIGKLLTAMKKMAKAIEKSEIKLKKRADELARSNADLEQFAYIASHDLQEPLRMVSSYTQLLSRRYKGQLDESADEFIHFAVDGVNRMKCLINDLLTYSRLGRGEEEFRSVDLNKTLENTKLSLQEIIKEKSAKITSNDLPTLNGDAIKLEQLFQNLISNAIKFKSDETPQIEVEAKETEKAFRISFSDNGIGVDPEYRERIFQIFQRLHGKSEYPGTGIGLAVCKRIVEYHKGKIWVESGSGNGTKFVVELPK